MENAIWNNYFDRNNYLIYSHQLSYLFNIIFVWVFHSLRLLCISTFRKYGRIHGLGRWQFYYTTPSWYFYGVLLLCAKNHPDGIELAQSLQSHWHFASSIPVFLAYTNLKLSLRWFFCLRQNRSLPFSC